MSHIVAAATGMIAGLLLSIALIPDQPDVVWVPQEVPTGVMLERPEVRA